MYAIFHMYAQNLLPQEEEVQQSCLIEWILLFVNFLGHLNSHCTQNKVNFVVIAYNFLYEYAQYLLLQEGEVYRSLWIEYRSLLIEYRSLWIGYRSLLIEYRSLLIF